jgi:hypothetical protein
MTGKKYPALLDKNDEMHQKLPGLHIITMIDETNELNEFMYSTLRSDMEHGRFIFPPPQVKSEFEIQPREEAALKEIYATQNELLKLQRVMTSRGFKLEPPNKKVDRKDRATSTVLANFWFIEENKVEKEPEYTIPQGVWITPRQESW